MSTAVAERPEGALVPREAVAVAPLGQQIVCFILDKSGSMGSLVSETLQGVNEYVRLLQEKADALGHQPLFTLTLFDTEAQALYVNRPIREVPELTGKEYQPMGFTALLDAIGVTVERVQDMVRSEGQDPNVLVVVMTDGLENASRRFTQAQVSTLIRTLEKTGKWSFVYLGAHLDKWDAASTAGGMGFQHSSSASWNRGNVRGAMSRMSGATAAYMGREEKTSAGFFAFGASAGDGVETVAVPQDSDPVSDESEAEH